MPQDAYARVVAETVTGQREDPTVEAALRLPALAPKTLDAVRFHIEEANANINRSRNDPEKRRRQEHFRHKMGVWRRQLERVMDGVRAQQGYVSNRPNPRARAYERMVGTTITCDCGCGHRIELYPVFRRILEDEKAKVKRARKQRRRKPPR